MASKSSIEAAKAHVTLGVDKSALEAGLAAAQKSFQSFGKGIAAAGAGIAAIGASITAPFLYGLNTFSDWGSEMRTTMRQTGIGFEQLDYLMDSLRVTGEELVPMVSHISQVIVEAAQGSQQANDDLRALNLTVGELASLSHGDRIQRVAESIGAIGDATTRIRLTRGILGRSGLAANLEGGAAGMRERAARMDYLEGQPTQADQSMAAAYAVAQKELAIAIKGIWREIGAAAAPAMTDFFNLLIRVAVAAREFVTQNRAIFEIVFRVADVMATAGAAIGALGVAVYGASYAFSFVSGAIGIISGLIGTIGTVLYFASGAFVVHKIAVIAWGVAISLATYAVSVSMSALLFISSMATSGFGIFTVFGWAYVAAMTAVKIATWLSAAAVTVWNGAIVLANVIMSLMTAQGWMIVGVFAVFKVVTWLASIAMWAYTASGLAAAVATTIATAGVNLLIAAVVALIAVMALSPFVILGIAIAKFAYAMLHLGSAFRYIISGASEAASSISRFSLSIIDSVTVAANRTIAVFVPVFNRISQTAIEAWQGIVDAFNVGEWNLLWNILKAAVELVWLDIKEFARPIFVDWKFTALAIWNQIADGLVDAIHGAIVRIKQAMVNTWAFIREGWFTSVISAAGGDPNSELNLAARARIRVNAAIEAASIADREYGTNEAAGMYEDRARLIREELDRLRAELPPAGPNGAQAGGYWTVNAPPQIQQPGGFSPQQLRDIERNRRDEENWWALQIEEALLPASDVANRERIQREFNRLNIEASILANDVSRWVLPTGQGGPGEELQTGGARFAFSGFSAGQLFGAIGAQVNPVLRTNQILERMEDQLEGIDNLIDAVEEVGRLAGARVA